MATARNGAPKGGCRRKFYVFELKMAGFGAFWELILWQLNCVSHTHEPVSVDFGL